MRAAAAVLVLLALSLAGCTTPGTNPSLRPPCFDSSPVRIDIVTDKERYLPNELMNVTLALNTSGPVANIAYRSWELDLKSFDGHTIKAYFRDQDPDLGGSARTVPAGGRVTLQERFQPFRVSEQLVQGLVPGTYYLCAVLTKTDGTVLSGAKPFIADPPLQQF
jgi:hypothetical protein